MPRRYLRLMSEMEAEMNEPLNVVLGRRALFEQGYLLREPVVFEVVGRRHPRAVYIATRPLQVADSDGFAHEVQVGDLLTADEVAHSGSGLQRLVLAGDLVELSLDVGLPRLWTLAKERVARLEQVVADMLSNDGQAA